MVILSFGTYLLIVIFLVYAGVTSVRTLRSIYTDEFTTCVKKVWFILGVFVICFLIKAIFGTIALLDQK